MRIYKNHQHFDYMILESINELIDNGYCMLNHLYVNKGQEGAFEQNFTASTTFSICTWF